jgi:hypothetical protein
VITTTGTETSLEVKYIAFTELSTGSILDWAYWASRDGDTSNAPSRNAVYDKIESMETQIDWVIQWKILSWEDALYLDAWGWVNVSAWAFVKTKEIEIDHNWSFNVHVITDTSDTSCSLVAEIRKNEVVLETWNPNSYSEDHLLVTSAVAWDFIQLYMHSWSCASWYCSNLNLKYSVWLNATGTTII